MVGLSAGRQDLARPSDDHRGLCLCGRRRDRGAVAGAGILFYVATRRARGLPTVEWDGIAGISGVTWCLWLAGFLIFFTAPQLWLPALFMSGCGILIKVASKIGLIGVLAREEIREAGGDE